MVGKKTTKKPSTNLKNHYSSLHVVHIISFKIKWLYTSVDKRGEHIILTRKLRILDIFHRFSASVLKITSSSCIHFVFCYGNKDSGSSKESAMFKEKPN